MLDPVVDGKYYLSEKQVASFKASTAKAKEKGNGFRFEPLDKGKEVAHTIQTRAGSRQTDNYVAEPTIIEDFYKGRPVREYSQTSPTLRGERVGLKVKTANKQGYDIAIDGDGIDLACPDSNTRRGRVGYGVSKTLPTSDSQGVMDGCRIRKLTPLECWRLMGFDDTDFHKAKKVNSNTQLYKQAGNSIVVNVLEAILKELL